MGTWVVEVLEFEGVGLSVVVLPRRRWPGQHLVQHGEPNEEVQGGAGSRRDKQCQRFTALATAYDQMEGFPVIRLQGGCKCAKDLRQAIGKRIE